MNQHLQKFLGAQQGKPFNPQAKLELKRIVPYKFRTKKFMDQMRNDSQFGTLTSQNAE